MKQAAMLATILALGSPVLAQPVGGTGGAWQVRVGQFSPEGDSEFWRETEDVFGFDASSLDGLTFGFSYVKSVNNHFEVGGNVDFYGESVRSAYLSDPFVFHDTELQTTPITVDARFIPFGRYAGQGAQRRRQPVWYLGAGAGTVLWEYEEAGEFLDFTEIPPPVFFDVFVADGAAFETHVLTGVELPLGRVASLLFEARYAWADDELDDDFSGLGRIDLGGASGFVGASFRF